MVDLFAYSGDADQTPHSAASDLGLHCLLITHRGLQTTIAGSTPAEVSNILSWRLIMKYFLRSFSPFR